MRFSVIIPNTDSNRIGEILFALRNQTAELGSGEILVIGSDKPRLVEPDSRVHFIQTDEDNRFASDKRNIGIKSARGEILLFLDDDCVPRSNWIERHIQQHQNGHLVVGGAVEFPLGNYLQLADNVSAFHFMTHYTKLGYRKYLCTTNLSVHRSVIQNVGLLEPHKNRAEDMEWTLRFGDCGYDLLFDPSIIVRHDPNRSTWRSVVKHWVDDAPDTLRVRIKYEKSLGTPKLTKYRSSFLLGAPVVAAWATILSFSNILNLRHYWHTIPVVFITKLIWCLSAYKNYPKLNED